MSEIEIVDPEKLMETLRPNAGALLAVGVLQALLGSAAIAAPQIATPLSVEFLGVLLLFAAGLQLWQGIRLRSWKGTSLFVLAAALDLVLGGLLLLNPAQGAIALTLLLAILLVIQGFVRIALSMRGGLPRGSGGFLLAGILGLFLGGMLWWEWPGDSAWALGLLLGVNLLMGGLAMIMLALALRGSGGDGPAAA
ncbi:MAG: DUF308 domain-containing protein [Myxococcota bacterium]